VSVLNVLAVVTVTDWKAGVSWYERFFGRPADRNPMDGLAEWQVTAAGGLQVVEDAERAGSSYVTLAVDDLEGHRAALSDRQVDAGEITRGEVASFAQVIDPDGNTITLAQDASTG
jgi:predicted enzyme related to lactoylglutathione lyase